MVHVGLASAHDSVLVSAGLVGVTTGRREAIGYGAIGYIVSQLVGGLVGGFGGLTAIASACRTGGGWL